MIHMNKSFWNSSASTSVRTMTSHREALSRVSVCWMWITTRSPPTGTSENRGFRGRNKKIQNIFYPTPYKSPLPRQYMRGVVQTDQHTICGTDRSLPDTERRQSLCQADRTHRAGIPAVRRSYLTVRSTVTSTALSTRRRHAQQAAEAMERHGTEPASDTLRHILYVWSA